MITLLSNRTEGYMTAKPDRALCLNAGGRHLKWGTVGAGLLRYWWHSPRGESSVLTLADGTSFAVDFTRASSVDVMLVTTGPADGTRVTVGDQSLTFFFPTAENPPRGPSA